MVYIWSIIVKLNWNKIAGPFLIFPLGGFHAVWNTKRVISSSWREVFLCHSRKTRTHAHTVFFFPSFLSYFSLCLWWISTNYVLGSRPNMFFSPCCASFVSAQNKFCFAPSDYRRNLGGKKTRNSTEHGTNVWGKPVSHSHQRLFIPVYSEWPTCDKLKLR